MKRAKMARWLYGFSGPAVAYVGRAEACRVKGERVYTM